MLHKGDQIHDCVRGETNRAHNREKDPKHEFVGSRDSVTLGVDEDHHHFVEEHLYVADRNEDEAPQGENHE